MSSQIGSVTSGASLPIQTGSRKSEAKQIKQEKEAQPAFVLELSGTENAADRISSKLDSRALEEVKNQASSASDALRAVVEKLIARQTGHISPFSMRIEITESSDIMNMTQAEAAAAISEDGEWGVNAVSDKIVSFAKTLAGNDPSKIETLREAIDKGFAGVKKTLGGTLPDISNQTYDAVMSKLDDWAAESVSTAE